MAVVLTRGVAWTLEGIHCDVCRTGGQHGLTSKVRRGPVCGSREQPERSVQPLMLTILLIVIVVLLLLGGGFGYSRRGRRGA
jgi:hypothetical protein